VIVLENVTKSFRKQRVLDALSLDIAKSDRVALIGSNGAGKTTLIRCLLGEYVYDGVIEVFGRSPRTQRSAVLAGIGFVPQLPPPLRMPVAELVRFSARVSGCEEAPIAAVMGELGLDLAEVGSKPFVRLSGGQKQKILAAIALGRPTSLLILDEPTANLDPAARKALFDLLAKRGGDPMIVSSHRLEEVAGLVNRVIEMDRGRVVLDDRVADSGDPRRRLRCTIRLARDEPAFARAIAEWGFLRESGGCDWKGNVPAPDRLRFLGFMARYAGLVMELRLETIEDAADLGKSAAARSEGDARIPLR
jgi:ABC-2 type transport system ATP-binding protein